MKLKLKTRTKLPAALVGRTGIAVVKNGLTYNLDLDYSRLVQTSQFDAVNDLFAVWNKQTGVWNTINPAGLVAGSFYSAVSASNTVPDGTSLVAIQRTSPSTTALTLPLLANQGGKALVIVDWSTSVTNHTITITPAGGVGTTIMKAANWTINSSASQAAAVVLYPSLDLNSWYIAPLSNFLQAGTGAVPRAFQDKARDIISVRDFGCALDGTTDDTTNFQAAVNAAISQQKELFVPAGTARLTSAITFTATLKIRGEGAASNNPYPNLFSGKTGSWLYFDHAGKGISGDLANAADLIRLEMHGLGTIRNQPTPGAGAFTPTANDYDIYLSPTSVSAGGGFSVHISDCLLLNPTKGMSFNQAGHVVIDNVRMQPLQEGITIDNNFDTLRITNVHMWLFWSQNSNVTDYMLGHLKGLQLLGVDNPYVDNFFVFNAAYGIFIGNGAAGSAQLVQLNNIGLDVSTNGLYFDPAISNVDVYLNNAYMTGRGTAAPTNGIQMLGTSCQLFASNILISDQGLTGLVCTGTTNRVTINGLRMVRWDSTGAGAAAINCGSGSKVILTSEVNSLVAGTTVGGLYGGLGEIWGAWRPWTVTVQPATGAFGAAPTVSRSQYMISPDGKWVDASARIAFSNNGTGAGSLQVFIPVGTADGDWPCTAVERGVGTSGMQAWIDDGFTMVQILKSDNTYPATNASIFKVKMGYKRV